MAVRKVKFKKSSEHQPLMTTSKDVTTTGKNLTPSIPGIRNFWASWSNISSRFSWLPWYSTAGIYIRYHYRWIYVSDMFRNKLTRGVNLFSSDIQFGRVESGAQIKNGPTTPLLTKCAMREMHCTVLPKPISSARIPFMPFSYSACVELCN